MFYRLSMCQLIAATLTIWRVAFPFCMRMDVATAFCRVGNRFADGTERLVLSTRLEVEGAVCKLRVGCVSALSRRVSGSEGFADRMLASVLSRASFARVAALPPGWSVGWPVLVVSGETAAPVLPPGSGPMLN